MENICTVRSEAKPMRVLLKEDAKVRFYAICFIRARLQSWFKRFPNLDVIRREMRLEKGRELFTSSRTWELH